MAHESESPTDSDEYDPSVPMRLTPSAGPSYHRLDVDSLPVKVVS